MHRYFGYTASAIFAGISLIFLIKTAIAWSFLHNWRIRILISLIFLLVFLIWITLIIALLKQ